LNEFPNITNQKKIQ